MQDEHPALPDNVTEDMQGFLLECFQKDPQWRPGARALLRHAWLRQQRATLRSTWSNTVKAHGGRADAHASVTNVVERILQVWALPSEACCISLVQIQLWLALSFAQIPKELIPQRICF